MRPRRGLGIKNEFMVPLLTERSTSGQLKSCIVSDDRTLIVKQAGTRKAQPWQQPHLGSHFVSMLRLDQEQC